MILKQKHSLIGMDITRNSLKLVQFRSKGGRPALLAAARLDLGFPNNGNGLDEQAAFVRQLKKLLAARRFGTRRAAISLPPQDLDIRPLTLPVDEHDVAKKVRWEAESYVGYDIENAVIDHVVLGEAKSAGERRLEVLAASADKAKVVRSLELLGRAGLVVEAIDILPLAICRVLHAMHPEPERAVAAIDVGAHGTRAVIMYNDELRMTRPIDIGGDALTQAICSGLEISTEEAEVLKHQHGAGAITDTPADPDHPTDTARFEESVKIPRIINDILRDKLDFLASELQKLFRYFSAQNQGRTIEQVVLVGGGASLKHLDTLLAERLNTQVEVGEPLTRIATQAPELKEGNEGSFAAAAGLALRGMSDADRQPDTPGLCQHTALETPAHHLGRRDGGRRAGDVRARAPYGQAGRAEDAD